MNFFDYFIRYYIHLAFGVTYVLTELICTFAVAFIFNHINPKKPLDYLRLLMDWAVTFTVFLLLSCTLYYISESTGAKWLDKYMRFIIWPLVTMLHTVYPKNHVKYINRLTCAIFSSFSISMSVNLSGAIGSFITNTIGHFPQDPWLDYTLYIVLFGLIAIICLFKGFSPFKYKYVKPFPVILINVIFFLSFAVTILTPSFVIDQPLFSCCLYVILLAISFLSYIIFYFLTKNYNSVIDYQVKALKAESEKNQVEISKGQYEELHRIRHDLKNQMNILEDMVKRQDYDGMKEYFADLNEKVHITVDTIESNNLLVNSILNMELSKAKSLGVKLDTHLSLPDELDMDSQDLTSLLTNLIDNALEAEVTYKLYKPIDLRMMYEKNYLFVKVSNEVPENIDRTRILSLRSNKKNRSWHGYGTKIIRSVCQKYNGTCKFDLDGNHFVFDGMLYLPMNFERMDNDNEKSQTSGHR